ISAALLSFGGPSVDSLDFSSFLKQRTTRLDTILKHNKSLQAAQSRVTIAKESVKTITLDPPQIGFEFFQSPVKYFPNIFKDQMEVDYSIQQMFPFPGKLSSMIKAESYKASMRETEVVALSKEVSLQFAKTYNELYLIDRYIELNYQSRDLLNTIIIIARKRYESGLGNQTEILRAQTEYSNLLLDSITLSQNRVAAQTMINALLPSSVHLPIPYIPHIMFPFTSHTIIDTTHISIPDINAMKIGTDMIAAEKIAAKKEYYPDIMVRGMYKQMIHSSDDWSLMLGLTIPVAPWSIGKFKAQENRIQAQLQESQAQIDNMVSMFQARLHDALSRVERFTTQAEFFRTTSLPQAYQTTTAAINAYQNGMGDLLMVLDSQKMLLMTNKEYQMTIMNLLNAYADIDRLHNIIPTGESIDRR
ncbi:MAG TPA: TolC family protein, partial [Chitinispirillaceae bacterium]|nr:TolC family protein [Chitinispirillaceae bacterium]